MTRLAPTFESACRPFDESRDGFVIYRVDSRKKSENIPLEQVRSEIQQRLFSQKFGPEMERFVAQLKEDAYIQIFGDAGK